MVLSGGTSRRSGSRWHPPWRGSSVTGPVAFSCLALFTLGFWTLLLRARVSGKRLPRCFGVNPRLLLEEFQLSLGDSPRAVRTWKSGHLATLFAQYLARQWIQVFRLLLEAFGRISSVVFVKVELGSCGRLTSFCSGFLRVVQFGEVCTVVASIPWTA